MGFDDIVIDGPLCPTCPTLQELCHYLTSNSSELCQHSPINSPTFHTGIEGHRRCEIDEGALVKMSVGDHWPEREKARERGRERTRERVYFWVERVTDRSGKSSFS